MLPITFDRHVLASPLLDYDDSSGRLMKVLRAIVERRVLPSFADDETVDRVQLARASERYSLARMEEPAGNLEMVSILVAREGLLDSPYSRTRLRLFCLWAAALSVPRVRLPNARGPQSLGSRGVHSAAPV